MTDRPILFSAPMVRAILAGTKTQTRRTVKPQPTHPLFGNRLPFMLVPDDEGEDLYLHSSCLGSAIRCPYGMPGDRLWVREAWRTVAGADAIPPRNLMNVESFTHYEADEAKPSGMGKLRPGMFMPRWASRITLTLTDVRVERLQDISEADAQAEGIAYSERFRGYCIGEAEHFNSHDPRQSYFSLWEAINGAGSVAADPWVWVVEFTRAAAALSGDAGGVR